VARDSSADPPVLARPFRSRIVARMPERARITFSGKASPKFVCATQQKGLET
jgi:hypothetical protein